MLAISLSGLSADRRSRRYRPRQVASINERCTGSGGYRQERAGSEAPQRNHLSGKIL
jgi:hypothetical protein